MPLNPGNQTLTFNPPGQFSVDRLHTVPASSGLSSFTLTLCCNLQGMTVKDRIEDTAYAEATDKAFTPYNANTSAVTAEWYIQDAAGAKYRILGTHNTPDQWGRFYQCQFIVKKETG
jgi:hypothetical protein